MSVTRELAQQVARGVVRGRPRLADRSELLGKIMVAPALIYVLLLVGVPFVLALVLSLSETTAGSLSFQFVGLRNFARVIHDPIFRRAVSNTLLVTVTSQVLVIILATTLARVLSTEFRGFRPVRFLILMPWAAPVALSSMAWVWIFDSTFSVINWTLRALGLLGPGQWLYWFGDTTLAMAAIIIVHVWRILPFATVVLLAGFTSLPREVQEAAVVDGAGFWRRLFQVELPLLLPVVTVAVLFSIVFTATDLGVVYLLTRGGPYNTTHVLSSYAFQQGILGADLGQGAAIAVFLFPLLALVAVGMLRVARGSEVGQ